MSAETAGRHSISQLQSRHHVCASHHVARRHCRCMAAMYESEVSDHCYSGPSYSLPRSHALGRDNQIRGLIATVWIKASVKLAVLNLQLQHVGSLTFRPTLWLVRLLISKLLAQVYVTFVRSGATQFNLSHQEDAAIEYTGFHRLFIKNPWLDVSVQSYCPILFLNLVGVQAS